MVPSGSGKTTLLTLLGGLARPTDGGSGSAGGRSIGFVFQSFNLIDSLSALENVLLLLNLDGRYGADASRRAAEILDRVGLAERLQHHPDELSAGERQRVAIARVLVNDPAVILADEPTASLDGERGLAVMELLRAEATVGRAVAVVSHDQRLARFADRRLEMYDGCVTTADGR